MSGALLVGVPLFFLIRGRVPTSAAALIMVFAMLPGFLLALYEKLGQPLEVVARQIVEWLLHPAKERPYQTNNAYTALVRQSQMEKEVKRHCPKSKRTNRAQKRRSSSPAPKRKRFRPSSESIRRRQAPFGTGQLFPMRHVSGRRMPGDAPHLFQSALSLRTSATNWRRRTPDRHL